MDFLLSSLGLSEVPKLHIILAFLCATMVSIPLMWRLVSRSKPQEEKFKPENSYTNISAIPGFNWSTEEPIKLRPFKPKYNLTMAVEQTTFDQLIAIDKTYLERIKWRREIMKKHLSDTVIALPGSEPLVNELYTWLFGTYLPSRFPSMFILIAPASSTTEKSRGGLTLFLRNRVTAESVSVTPPTDPVQAMRTISSHIDTDFLLLDRKPVATDGVEEEEKYHLVALANCTPSGFAPAEKIALPLAEIHRPVPGYAQRLAKSMDRYFDTLPTGKIVQRANWTVTTDDTLFCLKGNHFAQDGEEVKQEVIERQRKELKVEECRLRTERQTLHRLEQTQGLCFAFKTYLYPLEEIKREGLGEDMAIAVEGLALGNVPDMKVYKRQVVWGDKVVEYLRSGNEQTTTKS